jgi:hypothetical protein
MKNEKETVKMSICGGLLSIGWKKEIPSPNYSSNLEVKIRLNRQKGVCF